MNCSHFRTIFLLLVCICAFNLKSAAQERVIPKGWKQVKACDFTFLVPKKFKDAKPKSLDSCIAGFRSKQVSVYIDVGNYNGETKQDETMLDFKEEFVTVDGKKAQIVTYIEESDFAKEIPNRKFVTVVYIKTSEQQLNDVGQPFSLWMKIRSESSQQQETAKQIAQSILF